MSTRICAVTIESTSLQRLHKPPDQDHSIHHRVPPAWAYKSYAIMITSSQKYTRQTWVVPRLLILLVQEILGQWVPGGGLCKSHYVTPFPALRILISKLMSRADRLCPILLVHFWTHSCTPESPLRLAISKSPRCFRHIAFSPFESIKYFVTVLATADGALLFGSPLRIHISPS
jgi:hypothetical protein